MDFTVRVGTWNIHSGVPLDQRSPAPGLLAERLRRSRLDLVGIQEDLIDGDGSLSRRIGARIGLAHGATFHLSASHVVAGSGQGISVLSRYPVRLSSRIALPNPGVTVDRPDGTRWYSHDKGVLVCAIDAPARTIRFVTGHLLPFSKFHLEPSSPAFQGWWRAIGEVFAARPALPTIVGGDFNTVRAAELLAPHLNGRRYTALIEGPTTIEGARHDQLFCSTHFTATDVEVLPTETDHHLCVATLRSAAP